MSSRYDVGEIDDLLDQVTGADLAPEWIGLLKELFQYQGFDPRLILSLLKAKEGDTTRFARDMQALVVFGITRGTRVSREKVIERTSDEGKDVILRLKTKYGIKDIVPKTSKDITLARVLGVFPYLIARMMTMPGLARVIGTIPEGLPVYLAFPGAPAIIPTDNQALFDLWRSWAYSFDQVINRDAPSPANVDLYANITWNSPLYSDADREILLRKLRAVVEEGPDQLSLPRDRSAVLGGYRDTIAGHTPDPARNEKETQRQQAGIRRSGRTGATESTGTAASTSSSASRSSAFMRGRQTTTTTIPVGSVSTARGTPSST